MCFFNVLQRIRFGRYQRYPSTHKFFPLLLASQTWIIFSGEFTWKMDDDQFAWILCYIWKGRNNKVFNILDMSSRETLKFAEIKSTLWAEAQVLKTQTTVPNVETLNIPSFSERWCFSDGSWKENEVFSGQGWYSTLQGYEGLLGARNVKTSLSPLYSEMEALLWTMECMKNLCQYRITFTTDCS